LTDIIAKKGHRDERLVILREPVSHSSIHVQSGGSLILVCINIASKKIKQDARVESGGSLHIYNITLGSDVDHTLHSEVIGERGQSSVDWMFYATKKDNQKLWVRNVFSAPYGKGEITINGIAQGHSYVSCNGMIVIGQDGNQTQTHLSANTLMLDDTARIRAIPALEIKTNNVRASHSATISKVSDEDLFYLGSRGIARNDAKRMLVEGFIQNAISRIETVNIRQKVFHELQNKLTSSVYQEEHM
jgi:Fe-S cluster assembly scaffold protein SufB